jgi:hypothetical protein
VPKSLRVMPLRPCLCKLPETSHIRQENRRFLLSYRASSGPHPVTFSDGSLQEPMGPEPGISLSVLRMKEFLNRPLRDDIHRLFQNFRRRHVNFRE